MFFRSDQELRDVFISLIILIEPQAQFWTCRLNSSGENLVRISESKWRAFRINLTNRTRSGRWMMGPPSHGASPLWSGWEKDHNRVDFSLARQPADRED